MKVAILSESPADEIAVRILIEAALGYPVIRVFPTLRARGWPSVLQILPMVIRHLHFNTDAEALAVVVDSDDTVVHTSEHTHHPQCRYCQLSSVFHRTLKKLPPTHGRSRVLQGVGVAVPAMEAWYLCGRDESVTEDMWTRGQADGVAPYTRRELKRRVYGTERPSLDWMTRCAVADMQRHAADLRRLENDFPGFRVLSDSVKAWPKERKRDQAHLPPLLG